MRKDHNNFSEEEKQAIALLEGIIKAYTATLAIIYARIQSPKLLHSKSQALTPKIIDTGMPKNVM
jgi:hypothetical protein